MSNVEIPSHVIRPGPTMSYVKSTAHADTRRAGLGYAILRALGAHEHLSQEALRTVKTWSGTYGAANGGVTPNPMRLTGQDFDQRVGPRWGAHRAAPNAACYPGFRDRPPYARIFEEVWIRQRWPDLCRALGGGSA